MGGGLGSRIGPHTGNIISTVLREADTSMAVHAAVVRTRLQCEEETRAAVRKAVADAL